MGTFFITVIKHNDQYFSSITNGEPSKPLKRGKVVFSVSEEIDKTTIEKLISKAKVKAREMGIAWVSGLDNPPKPRSTPVPYLRLVN